ncbi:ribosome small subunit-dependent GTPase A [Aldersonia kunmingensis]|uniref:ribosome small subunit-dependent GTPase A n=1 Tax=Aldersonia kunmingensis TaxID=408066 RepID=UPI00083790CD|nr:ribosome small subunit-dependent GTPase A [Aldersonia kunmingensis]
MVDSDLLHRYGFDDSVAALFTATERAARVVRVDRGESTVVAADGELRARSGQHVVCAGDWVALDENGDIDRITERRSLIQRATVSARSDAQLLAANVDTALIAVPLDRDPALGGVERYLALIWEAGSQPVIVATKADAAEDLSSALAQIHSVAMGVPVLSLSAATGAGIDELIELLSGAVAVLGPSGAGKSTLANALLGRNHLATNAVRDGDHRGRHTTVARELVPLPFGGTLIDTPGLRSVGLWDAGAGLEQTFADIEELARGCRFSDCAHGGEPGCAVQRAVDADELPERRLESYRKLTRENEWMADRSDARKQAERTRSVKVQSRALRAMYRERGH